MDILCHILRSDDRDVPLHLRDKVIATACK